MPNETSFDHGHECLIYISISFIIVFIDLNNKPTLPETRQSRARFGQAAVSMVCSIMHSGIQKGERKDDFTRRHPVPGRSMARFQGWWAAGW